jgi:hypothetical protein
MSTASRLAMMPGADMTRITECYLLGIKEGREYMRAHGAEDAAEHIECCDTIIARNPRGSAKAEMARGERDFWLNQTAETTQ